MESKTHAPSFTVSLRGYDRMEVDEYLDSLAEALAQVEEAEDRCQGLRSHVDRLNARIAELEARIKGEVPKSGAVLGERISMILSSAEEAATETVARAEASAEEILRNARMDAARTEDQARGASVRSAEQARRTEATARAEATEIVAEAEARASARTRQIEQWAEQVVSHTRAEEARMLQERATRIEEVEAEIQGLIDSRDGLATALEDLGRTLSGALAGLGGPPAARAGVEPEHAAVPMPEPAAVIEAPAVADALLVADRAPEGGDEDHHQAVQDEATGEVEAVHVDVDLTDLTDRADEADEADDDGPEVEGWGIDGTGVDGTGVDGAEVEDSGVDGSSDDSDEMPWPAAFSPIKDLTGDIDLADPEFDSKFEAWVTESDGEPKHFKGGRETLRRGGDGRSFFADEQ